MALFPTLTYTNVKHKVDNGFSNGSIRYTDEPIVINFDDGSVTTTYKVSYNAPFNEITGTFTSDRELSRFEVRVTPISPTNQNIDENAFGPGEGALVTLQTGISANTARSFSIPITADKFTGSSNDTYRVCLAAQSAIDYSWDATQLYITVNNTDKFIPASSSGLAVHYDTTVTDTLNN